MTLSKFLCLAVPLSGVSLAIAMEVFNPIGGPLQTILGLALVFGPAAWFYARQSRYKDEVVRTANRASTAFGALIGIGASIIAAVVVRYTSAADLINAFAADSRRQEIGLAAVGFGLGISFTCMLVGFSIVAAWATWWLAKR